MNYAPWSNSPIYPIVVGSSGHTDTIMNQDQLFRFLDKSCGKEITDVIKYEIYTAGEFNKCTGECDHTYAIEEEYQSLLHEISYTLNELLEIKSVQASKKAFEKLEYILKEIKNNT